MIVKIQRAIYPPDHSVLVYDKRRKFTQHMPFTPEIREAMGDDVKAYFDVTIEKQGYEQVMVLLRRVDDCNW